MPHIGPTLDYQLGQWALILRMPHPLGLGPLFWECFVPWALPTTKLNTFCLKLYEWNLGSLVIFENWIGQILMCTMNAKGKMLHECHLRSSFGYEHKRDVLSWFFAWPLISKSNWNAFCFGFFNRYLIVAIIVYLSIFKAQE